MNSKLKWTMVILFLIILFMRIDKINAAPEGVFIESNYTELAPLRPATSITTAGGTFTTLVMNATTQDIRWKAYVGNISGKLTLDDGGNYTIYDWTLVIVAGEVYASRNDSITWSNINCSNITHIKNEEVALNITSTKEDSITNTFKNKIHKGFVVGNRIIQNSTCPAIATYVNDTAQTASEQADFQEILLSDGSSIVFSTLLEPNSTGFDNEHYNFQMIVPEKAIPSAPTTYYFYTELG